MSPPTFKLGLVEQLFQSTWAANAANATDVVDSDSSEKEDLIDSEPLVNAASVRKIHADAVKLSAEMLRLFVIEACRRAQMEAMVDDSETVEPQHIEQILAQLLLDF